MKKPSQLFNIISNKKDNYLGKKFYLSTLTTAILGAVPVFAVANTADQDTKTYTVNTPTIVPITEGPDLFRGKPVKHGRLFANVELAGADGSDVASNPAASMAEVSGYTLNIQEAITCPLAVTEQACPIGAARIEHDGNPNAISNNNKVVLSDSAQIQPAEPTTKQISVFGSYVYLYDKADESAVNAVVKADNNQVIVNNLISHNQQNMVGSSIYVSTPSAQTGAIDVHSSNNSVLIEQATITKIRNGSITGGSVSANGKKAVSVSVLAENNKVDIHNGSFTYDIWAAGGKNQLVAKILGAEVSASTGRDGIASLIANNNRVSIQQGNFNNLLNGIIGASITSSAAQSKTTAQNNAVKIAGGTFTDLSQVTGANVQSGSQGTNIVGNKVDISGGEFIARGDSTPQGGVLNPLSPSFMGGFVWGTSTGIVVASQNSVVISGGQSEKIGPIWGAVVQSQSVEHALNENSVKISGGTWGAVSIVDGAASYSAQNKAELNRNTVEISGGQFSKPIDNIFGARAILGSPTGDTQELTATGNQVLLSTNVPAKFVAGVYAGGSDLSKTTLKLTDNKVILSSAPVLDNAIVSGAYVPPALLSKAVSADIFTGNTLVLDNYTGTSKLGSVGNFQYYQFVLPESHVVNESVALTTTDLLLDSPTDANKHAEIQSVSFAGSPRALNVGDKIYLIDADTINGTLGNKDQTLMVQQGVTLETETIVKQEPNKIYLLVDRLIGAEEPQPPVIPEPEPEPETEEQPSGPEVSQPIAETPVPVVASHVKPEAKTFSEGYLAGALATIRAGDLLAGQGITEAKLVKERFAKWKGFGIASGIKGRYDTGSHIDTRDTSMIVGLVRGFHLDKGDLTVGAFFEAGRSRYDTYNDVIEGGVGNGTVDYSGGGLLARFDARSGFYAEGSVRAGQARNQFDSGLVDGFGRVASYKANAAYFSFHVGLGYEWQLNDKLGSEVYAKYLYSRLNGKDVVTTTGDKLSFDSVESQRIRAGGRLHWKLTDRVTPYVGLAVEQEMGGKATATTFGLPIAAPSLKGTSGMAEVGLRVLPTEKSGWAADINVRGYTGKRKEIGGNLRVSYRF
ncbi:autotransporter outer membrane beta-barrel domain-containing protein [Pelistega europaea]|uniref:Autotransporter domain-containing protein n=1 Tax=Pelistega europaea TaxID=106147 RepID=A0A7Y4L9X3_9BURK|nr:autotransporter domain-containing protein [Pelistega europaea]NOL49637.1 autotransporter domain-containing protein [Pelistega europaea]